MQRPIFADEDKHQKYIAYTFGGLVVLFAAAAVVIGVILGIKQYYQLLFYALLLILHLACTGLLIKWYREDGLDPKFKVLMIAMVVVSVLIGVDIFMFAFGLSCPGDKCWATDPKALVSKDNPEVCRTPLPDCVYSYGCYSSSDSGMCGQVTARTNPVRDNTTVSWNYTCVYTQRGGP